MSIVEVWQRDPTVSTATALEVPPRYPELVGPPDASDAAALSELLDAELAFDATTSTRLSNHLPMALVALHRLGASDDRLAEFASGYRGRLAPVPAGEPVGDFDEWRAARGRRGAYGSMRGYFDRAIERDGVDSVVRRHVAHLADGLSGAAFHGIIRLAYSLESESDARVAAGLAYLSEVYQPLGAKGRSAPWTTDPAAALRRLSDVAVLQRLARTGNIGERMRQVASHPSFAGVVDWLEVTDDTPARLTAAAVALYAATDDFTALHGVTASHAIMIVSRHVDDTAALSSWWFQALAAAYVTIGAPRLTDPVQGLTSWLGTASTWDEIGAAATRSDDEHVVKLVYSARELHAATADPLLLPAAARRVGATQGAAGG
ncbi:MAG TPA: questin oxidase family protein [Acidimicrobiales bacterium]